MTDAFPWDSRLLSLDTGEFDRALTLVRRSKPSWVESPSVIATFAEQLKQATGIPRREFDRRLRLVVSAAIESRCVEIQDVASALREVTPEALNAVRTLLPIELRHLASQSRSAPEAAAVRETTTAYSVNSPSLVEDQPSPNSSQSQHRAVLLVGTKEEHQRNEAMLRNAGLDHFYLSSLEQFWNFVPTGLCGFVVAASAWSQIPHEEQRQAVIRLCKFSTFIFARIGLDGLEPSNATSFTEDALSARCGHLEARTFCQGQDCNLTSADIQTLKSIASLLEKSGKSDFFPLGLNEQDTALLRLIAADRSRTDDPVVIRKLGTRELPGGRSGAKVFLLSDGHSQPFVAKVHDVPNLVEELQRYQKHIAEWEPNIAPRFHSHQERAAISYRLLTTPGGNGTPAPTLEECLEDLRAAEWNSDLDDIAEKAANLCRATSYAIDHLVELNSRPCEPTLTADEFWLDWPIRYLATNRICVQITRPDATHVELSDLIAAAMECLQPSLRKATIHGDIQGRNILLLDRLPAFIDFRCSGPGHPLVDIVRLDATVRAIAMRMLFSKHIMSAVFEAIYIQGQPAEQVLLDWRAFAASPLTALSIRVAAKCREEALKIARLYSLDPTEYFAMTCVVSSHVLAAHNPGSGIERILLSVLAPQILDTNDAVG